jgi:broad specificity phosphatase PhoE
MLHNLGTILFIRHADTLPKDADGDIGRKLSPVGRQRAIATSTDLASRKFRLAVNTGVNRTIHTCNLIAANQPELEDIVSVRSLYLPMDESVAAEMMVRFDETKTARKAKDVPLIWEAATKSARMLDSVITMMKSDNTVVVDHMVLIQHMVYALCGRIVDAVLDVELGPCDGIALTPCGDLGPTWEIYRAPKLAAA